MACSIVVVITITSGQKILTKGRIACLAVIEDWIVPFYVHRSRDSQCFSVGRTTKKRPFPVGDIDPHLIHGSLGPAESILQSASRSVQPFLQTHERDQQTNRHTDKDRPRYSFCRNRPHLAIFLWCGLIAAVVHHVIWWTQIADIAANDRQTPDQASQPTNRLLPSIFTISIYYYYYSTQSWYLFYRPAEGRSLSLPGHYSKGVLCNRGKSSHTAIRYVMHLTPAMIRICT